MAVERAGSQDAVASRLGITPGHLTKLLYGDHKAGRDLAETIRVKLKIPLAAWAAQPSIDFMLPGATPAPAAP